MRRSIGETRLPLHPLYLHLVSIRRRIEISLHIGVVGIGGRKGGEGVGEGEYCAVIKFIILVFSGFKSEEIGGSAIVERLK